MIDRHTDPEAWAVFSWELEDAHEHLGALLRRMDGPDAYDEVDFRTDLGHVYAHLNRAWNGRDATFEDPDPDTHAARSRFPTDLEPIG